MEKIVRNSFLKLILIRLKYFAKNWIILSCLFVSILASFFYAYNSYNAIDKNRVFNIAIVNYDNAEFSNTLLEKLYELDYAEIQVVDKKTAIRQLSLDKIDGVFIIHDDFTKKLYKQEYKDSITLYTTVAMSSASPISDFVSTQVMYMWLKEMVEARLTEVYNNTEDKKGMSLVDILSKIEKLDEAQSIINIKYFDLSDNEEKKEIISESFLYKVSGIFACFAFFAIVYSAEWIFTLKKKALRQRLSLLNISITSVCWASLLSCVILCTITYVILILLVSTFGYLSLTEALNAILFFVIYFIGVGGISFIITFSSKDSNQFLILGSAAGLLHLSLSQLIVPLPEWAKLSKTIAYILPGSQLVRCFADFSNITPAIIICIFWLAISFIILMLLNKTKTFNNKMNKT